MNENINLCEILKDCGSITLYSSIFGDVELTAVYSELTEFPIKVTSKDCYIQSFRKDGKYYDGGGECVLFPSKEQRDWSKFERPIPIDTPMMVSDIKEIGEFRPRFYSGVGIDGHCVFTNGDKSNNSAHTCHWKYMIRFEDFNPNDIEETLKHNIQK